MAFPVLLALVALIVILVSILLYAFSVKRPAWALPAQLSVVVNEQERIRRNFLSPNKIVENYFPAVTTCFENFEHAKKLYPKYPFLGTRLTENGPYSWESYEDVGKRRDNCECVKVQFIHSGK